MDGNVSRNAQKDGFALTDDLECRAVCCDGRKLLIPQPLESCWRLFETRICDFIGIICLASSVKLAIDPEESCVIGETISPIEQQDSPVLSKKISPFCSTTLFSLRIEMMS